MGKAIDIKVEIEFLDRGEEYPTPWRAHIWTGRSDHHGEASTAAKALFNAVGHWCRYEDKLHGGGK